MNIAREKDDFGNFIGFDVSENFLTLLGKTGPFVGAFRGGVGKEGNGADDDFGAAGSVGEPAFEGLHLLFSDHEFFTILKVPDPSFGPAVEDEKVAATVAVLIPQSLRDTDEPVTGDFQKGAVTGLIGLVGVSCCRVENFPVLVVGFGRPIIFDFMVIHHHVGGDICHEAAKVGLAEGFAVALEELMDGAVGCDDVEIVRVDLVTHHDELIDFVT